MNIYSYNGRDQHDTIYNFNEAWYTFKVYQKKKREKKNVEKPTSTASTYHSHSISFTQPN